MKFDVVGIMAALSTALATAGISLLAQSTFDTDYIFLKSEQLESAKSAFLIEGISLKP